MEKDNIELPPLPASEEVTRQLENAFPWVEVHILMVDYAHAAIKAYRQQRGGPVAWVSQDMVLGQSVGGRPRRIWWENNAGVGIPIYTAPQPEQRGDPVAYAVFADNGNIRIWQHEPLDWPEAVPLYTAPRPAAPEQEPSDEELIAFLGEIESDVTIAGANHTPYLDKLKLCRALLARYGSKT